MMANDRSPQPPPHVLWRALAAQLIRLASVSAAVLLILLGISVAAAAIQAGRDEARHADTLLVLAPEIPPQPLIDHTLELYRRGYASRVLLVGPGQAQARGQLIDRGVPAEAIGLPPPAPSTSAWLTGAVAQSEGASALVVAGPGELLSAIKLAQDNGLRAYGSPPPGSDLRPLDLLSAGLRYWGYVLGGSY